MAPAVLMRFTPEPHTQKPRLPDRFPRTIFRGVYGGEDLDVFGIANLLAWVDVDKDGRWSLVSFRRPQ